MLVALTLLFGFLHVLFCLTSLTSLTGCDEDTSPSPSQMLVALTLLFGFCMSCFLAVGHKQAPYPNPTRRTTQEPTAENYIAWMRERCSRRGDDTLDHDRRHRCEERVESLRIATRRTLGNRSDMSEDENSRNYRLDWHRLQEPTTLCKHCNMEHFHVEG